MEYILAICALPFLWVIASKFIYPRRISVKEMLIQCAITLVIVMVGYYVSKANLTSDTEIMNGQITSKESERVSCEHSYECHCRTVTTRTKNGTSSSRHCDTCYEHAYDVDWVAHSSIGDFDISRVDRQGLFTPPRWDRVVIGEPASKSVSYTNYVKGAKFSLFNFEGNLERDKKYVALIPAYPEVYDYYHINRVLATGVSLPDQQLLNSQLNDRLRLLGPSKQANIILVVVKIDDPMYRFALERAWVGGKKNDIIVIVGVTDYPKISWVDTITLAKDSGNELLQVRMRDGLLALQTLSNTVNITNTIASVVATDFHRKHMKDLKYLDAEIQPSMAAMGILYVLTLLVNAGLTWFFYKNEV